MAPAASHEDTSSDRPDTSRNLRPRPIRLGHMTNSLFTLQTTPRPVLPGGISLSPANVARHRRGAPVVKVPTGGGERIRTDDLLLAKQALSQLSYTPGPEIRKQMTESDLFSDLWPLISGIGGPGRI